MEATFLITLTSFVAVTGTVWGVSEALTRRARLVRDRVQAVVGQSQAVLSPGENLGPVRVVMGPTGVAGARPDFLPTITHLLSHNRQDRKLRLMLLRGGVHLRPAEFAAVCASTALGLAAVGMLQTHQAWIAAVLGGIGAGLPFVVLQQKQEARRRRFNGQINDALTLIASSLRSGYSFMRALQMVADEMPVPISEEVALALGEANLGVPLDTALGRLVERVRSYDFDLVVTAVNIQLQVGGNLAEILDTISTTIRERVRVQGEINSLTAEGKLTGTLLGMAPWAVALLLNLHNPHYYRPLLDSPVGVPIIIGAAAAQIVGMVIIKRMITIDI